MTPEPPRGPLRAAVFASGSGSNFQALLDVESGTVANHRGPGAGNGDGGVAGASSLPGRFDFVAPGHEAAAAASTSGAATTVASGGSDSPSEGGPPAHPAHPWRTVLLVSDRVGTGAARRAEGAGIPSCVVAVKGRAAPAVEKEMLVLLEEHGVEVIFLAGYLRLVPAGVVSRYRQRILNIHPALLPSFGGKGMWGRHVHRAVLDSGARITGPTVHFADDVYDRGTILAQWPVPVHTHDTPETLAARVLAVEHRLYPMVAWHVCRALRDGEEPTPLSPWDATPGTSPLPTL